MNKYVTRSGVAIAIHYLLTNLGLFGLLSTLVVSLRAAGFSAPQVGGLVIVFTITNKIAKIPLAPWLDRIPAPRSALIGCLVAAVGFLVLRSAHGIEATTVALVLAGLGISVNALASKQLAAAASDGTANRARTFSLINISVNVASAVAAPVALLLTERGLHGYVLLSVAGVYCLAGVSTFLRHAGHRVRPAHVAATSPSLRSYCRVARLPGMMPFLVINFLGWMLYGQLFNTLALHVSETLDSPGRLGWLYTLNALLVVSVQWWTTLLIERWSKGSPLVTVVLAYAVFTVAFLAAYALPGYGAAVAFVLIFTMAEMLFVPSVDVVLLGLIGQQSRAVGYAILSVSTALGEAVGGGAGVIVYRWLADRGFTNEYWLVAAALALAATALAHRLRTRSAGLRT
jgi:MFS transporter, DHA1 family, multidrug resistance protein